MSLQLISWQVGGQSNKYRDHSVAAGDFVVVQGSCSGGGTDFSLTGVSASLIADKDNNYTRVKIWLIQQSGVARVTQSGRGDNWDNIQAVCRPTSAVREWIPRIWYVTRPSSNAPVSLSIDVPDNTLVFVLSSACPEGNVSASPTFSGVACDVLVDILPEGGGGSGNSRATIVRTRAGGVLTIAHNGAYSLDVAFLLPAWPNPFEDFFLV